MSSLSASEVSTSGDSRRPSGTATGADAPAQPADPQQPDAPAVPSAPDAPADQTAPAGEEAAPKPKAKKPAAKKPAAKKPAATVEPRIERKYQVDTSVPPAVSVQDVSITYRTTFEKVPTLKSAIVRFGRGERAVREVEAIQNMSFDVPVGTALGILGANGAGKSTLMRALAGVLPPTSGRIEVRGKISSLLSLGVGFNSALTGRENVVLGGLAQGLTREQVAERADEIADFAEIGEFMDMPMRTYSSGMSQRLAFAVSVHMEPDILLIDEALSAGDAKFKNKAAAKMDELMSSARAMFLVSHSLGSIRQLCNDAIWIHKGKLMMRGTPEECGAAYTKFLEVGETAFTLEDF
ncbi:ABC transporter ATP-binding protein [Cellulomonas sp. CW35]|uniref:ABC transporter ATP-binding protein n=1 Tax=Cellulomonas sp. CW35 TaxID=3458249 RepID=UPI00403408E7